MSTITRTMLHDFLVVNFDKIPKSKTKYAEEDVIEAKSFAYEKLAKAQAVFSDKEHSVYVGKYDIIPPTVIEEAADEFVASLSFSEIEKDKLIDSFILSLDSTTDIDHYQGLNAFVKHLQSKLRGTRFELPGFRRINDEFEAWSRAGDIKNYSKSLFRYCVFFRTMRRLLKEKGQDIIDKCESVLARNEPGDTILTSDVTHYLDLIFACMYSVAGLNTAPSLMVPSAMIYQQFRKNETKYTLSVNAAADLLQMKLPENYIESIGTIQPMVVEIPNVLWMTRGFNLTTWALTSEEEKITFIKHHENRPHQPAEYADDFMTAPQGRNFVYLLTEDNTLVAHYATEQDLRQKIFSIRPFIQKETPKAWKVIMNFLLRLKSSSLKIKGSNGKFTIGQDNKKPPVSPKTLTWKGMFRIWEFNR